MGNKSSESEDSKHHWQPGAGFHSEVGSQIQPQHIVGIVCGTWTSKVRRNRDWENLCKEISWRRTTTNEGKGRRGRKVCWKNGSKARNTQRQPHIAPLPEGTEIFSAVSHKHSMMWKTSGYVCVYMGEEQLRVWDSCWLGDYAALSSMSRGCFSARLWFLRAGNFKIN